ncbi:imidazole glycerol phosphate synthase subunit HisF [Cryomorphaceae bacterium]|nr:imidazole glycerol phosphate synthase subunit HisF [Cryomorphaceae bacterium]
MLKKRIIPCLDIKNGRTVKGVNFKGLRDAGDPVQLAAKYNEAGADELIFLDISASEERRETQQQWVEQVAREVAIPFAVGGGISSVDEAYALLRCGADKICVNSAALARPQLIAELADAFGQQCVVLAIDATVEEGTWRVFSHGGQRRTDRELIEWAVEAETMGAGEILFTSMDHDGTKDGFALDGLRALRAATSIPIIASGGAGEIVHFTEVFKETDVEAALAASVFHFGEIEIIELKQALRADEIPVR